jgi:hypothetical protein
MNIDYPALEAAFQDSNYLDKSYWLNRETGEVLVADDWTESEAHQLASPYDTDDPHIRLAWCVLWHDGEIGLEEREEEDQEMVRAIMAPMIRVPQADSHEEYNLMVEFTATVRDRHLRELLEVALDGRGAFRRFKNVLASYPKERERWFAFRDEDLRQQIDAWLEAVGLLETEEDD